MGNSQKHFRRLLTIIIIVCTSIIALVLLNSFLYGSSQSEFGGSNFNMLTGMAISGFTEITSELPGANPYEVRINPAEATIILDTLDKNAEGIVNTYPFTIDIYAYPMIPNTRGGVNFDNYKVTVRYNSQQLSIKTTEAKNMVPGDWSKNVYGSNPIPGFIDFTYEANSLDGSTFGMTSTHLLELTFIPKFPGLEAPAQIVVVDVDINHALIGASPFDDYFGSEIYIKNRYYIDKDNDGFGDPNLPIEIGLSQSPSNSIFAYVEDNTDCDDNTEDDPNNCPTVVTGGCYGFAGIPITMYLDGNFKNCAICRNPGMTIDQDKDGVDTDCDGLDGGISDDCPECQVCPEGGDCVQEICDNNHDDDDDGFVDIKDSDCLGQQGSCSIGSVYVWTFTDGDTGEFSVPINYGCARLNYCISGDHSYPLGILHPQDPTIICVGHDYLTEWKKCKASNEGMASYNKLCKDGEWVNLNDAGENNVVQDDYHDKPFTEEQYHLLTPGCGLDADNDGYLCDYFESYYTCKSDCEITKICDPNEIIWNNGQNVYGNSDYCMVNHHDCIEVGLQCTGTDTDGDDLPDAYEVYLETKIPNEIKTLDNYVTWFDNYISDSDKDGINDDWDVCPGTNTLGGVLTLSTGKINVFGCYTSDVSRQIEKDVRPDGCFSSYDTTFYIGYYTNLLSGESCPGLYNK
jgi:hypothetical protein